MATRAENQTPTNGDTAGDEIGEAAFDNEIDAAQAELAMSAEDLQTELARAQAQSQASQEQFLRAAAELENFRKRAARDLEHARKYGLETFVSELLPVRDSLELGLAAASGEDATLESLQAGTEMTLRLLGQVMEKFGIVQINPIGLVFDPLLHEAMAMLESDVKPNTVIDVVQMGYQINDRLLRPARVVVAKAAEEKPGNTA